VELGWRIHILVADAMYVPFRDVMEYLSLASSHHG
jgi:hypothetical protein